MKAAFEGHYLAGFETPFNLREQFLALLICGTKEVQ